MSVQMISVTTDVCWDLEAISPLGRRTGSWVAVAPKLLTSRHRGTLSSYPMCHTNGTTFFPAWERLRSTPQASIFGTHRDKNKQGSRITINMQSFLWNITCRRKIKNHCHFPGPQFHMVSSIIMVWHSFKCIQPQIQVCCSLFYFHCSMPSKEGI